MAETISGHDWLSDREIRTKKNGSLLLKRWKDTFIERF